MESNNSDYKVRTTLSGLRGQTDVNDWLSWNLKNIFVCLWIFHFLTLRIVILIIMKIIWNKHDSLMTYF